MSTLWNRLRQSFVAIELAWILCFGALRRAAAADMIAALARKARSERSAAW
jgi:hypothetical protein